MINDKNFQNDIERLLLENLKLARENREYIIKIDRRQRWARNLSTMYWIAIVCLAVFGTYYAFPYLKEARETLSTTWEQISAFTRFTQQ